MIKNIEISRIHPHYNNPRKELGDLTELAESIKKTGILQNLTVVPWFSNITKSGADDPVKQEEMGYIAVIGHRRLAAAKLAGLKEVPCVISDMSYSEQIATMLLENMQRNDLTLYEQAEGFQMMLDLGESVGDISEKTGLSTTTVRRRVKLLDLDKEKFRQPVDDTDGLQYIRGYYEYELRQKNFTVEKRDDAESVEYFYKVANGDVVLYTKQNDVSQNDKGLNTERAERARRNKALKAITKRAYQLRGNFVKEISNAVAKKKLTTIIEYNMAPMIWSFHSCPPDIEDYTDFIGETPIIKDAAKEDDIMAAFIKNKIAAEPEKSFLNVTWLMLDSEYEIYYDWNEQYRCNKQLDLIYEFLEKLGYEISEEELALKNGTHELFAPVGGKEK